MPTARHHGLHPSLSIRDRDVDPTLDSRDLSRAALVADGELLLEE
jgi:hypothetical protein